MTVFEHVQNVSWQCSPSCVQAAKSNRRLKKFSQIFNSACYSWLQGITRLFSWKLMPLRKVGPVLVFADCHGDMTMSIACCEVFEFLRHPDNFIYLLQAIRVNLRWSRWMALGLYGSWSTFFPPFIQFLHDFGIPWYQECGAKMTMVIKSWILTLR